MFERLVQSLKKPAEEALKSSDFCNPKVEKVCNSEMAFIQSVISLYRGKNFVEDYPVRNDLRSRLTISLMSMPSGLPADEELSLATVRAAGFPGDLFGPSHCPAWPKVQVLHKRTNPAAFLPTQRHSGELQCSASSAFCSCSVCGAPSSSRPRCLGNRADWCSPL